VYNIFIPANKTASKLIDLMADSRILPAQWKFDIPMHLVTGSIPVLVSAKNLADGIEYNLARYGIEVPPEFMVAYPDDPMIVYQGKEIR